MSFVHILVVMTNVSSLISNFGHLGGFHFLMVVSTVVIDILMPPSLSVAMLRNAILSQKV